MEGKGELRLDHRTTMRSVDMHVAANDPSLMSILDTDFGVPIYTLYRWRHKGEGPLGYRIGRHVKYRRATVEAWLEMQTDTR
jgi:hypothetical protein